MLSQYAVTVCSAHCSQYADDSADIQATDTEAKDADAKDADVQEEFGEFGKLPHDNIGECHVITMER